MPSGKGIPIDRSNGAKQTKPSPVLAMTEAKPPPQIIVG